jgi:serine/threonine protein kinase
MHSSPLESVQNGRYQYVRLLGQGNIGSVYLMQDMYLNRKVAVKVMQIKPDRYPEKDAILHIQRSARVITSLEHPNILSLYDFGEEQDQQGNILTYNVMLFCPEGSLTDWLHQRGRSKFVAPQDVVYFITQAADALQYTHDHGVLHLNVKPSNFLVRGNARDPEHPYLQLSDFGAIQSGTPANLMLPAIPLAMTPELWNSKPVPATDQYALAVIAYQLLAGCSPFRNTFEQGILLPHH